MLGGHRGDREPDSGYERLGRDRLPGPRRPQHTETCTYPGAAAGVTLYYEVGPTPAAFRQAQSSLRNATSISGLGAAA